MPKAPNFLTDEHGKKISVVLDIEEYEKMLEEEAILVHKAVEAEMAGIKAGRVKTHAFEEVKKARKP